MKKRFLSGLATILFIFCVVGVASATTYAIDIGAAEQDGVHRFADFTIEGFDPLSEQVIFASVWQMVKSKSIRSTATAWLNVEDNGLTQESGVSSWEKISLTLYDFTSIDDDGIIEYWISSPTGSLYTGAGQFYIDTEAVDPVPIPSTISLLGLGILGLAGVSRKKLTQ